MGFGTGATYLNVNRDAMHPGTRLWYQGPNLDGPSDKTAAVIEFETPSGTPIAVYVNYAMHAINFYMLGILSADFAGATSRYVERTFDDKVVAIWSSGAAGDQNSFYLRPHYGARAAKGGLGNDQTGKAMIAGQPQDGNADRAIDILNQWGECDGSSDGRGGASGHGHHPAHFERGPDLGRPEDTQLSRKRPHPHRPRRRSRHLR